MMQVFDFMETGDMAVFFKELDSLNKAYSARSQALQKNWLNDWSSWMTDSYSASYKAPAYGSDVSSKSIAHAQQTLTNQLLELNTLIEDATESYQIWYLQQLQKFLSKH